jgi:hypothetical protein
VLVLGLLCLALVALLAYREWGTVRERRAAAVELARSRAETAASRSELAEERDRAAKERRELYQRIQAPEVAVADAALEARRERPYTPRKPIGADDDAAFAARSDRRQAERAAEEVEGG